MRVCKKSGKPFKSKLQINTVKGTGIHPITNRLTYFFEEDDSYVEQFRCEEVK